MTILPPAGHGFDLKEGGGVSPAFGRGPTLSHFCSLTIDPSDEFTGSDGDHFVHKQRLPLSPEHDDASL